MKLAKVRPENWIPFLNNTKEQGLTTPLKTKRELSARRMDHAPEELAIFSFGQKLHESNKENRKNSVNPSEPRRWGQTQKAELENLMKSNAKSVDHQPKNEAHSARVLEPVSKEYVPRCIIHA
jgi:hypothetical protein